jgi:hypothetical protein
LLSLTVDAEIIRDEVIASMLVLEQDVRVSEKRYNVAGGMARLESGMAGW